MRPGDGDGNRGGPDVADDEQQPAPEAPADVDARIGAIEDRQARQETMLEQILEKLSGQPAAPSTGRGDGSGASIAELVRQGIAELEQDKQRQQRENDSDAARRDHGERIAALEEAMPREAADTPAGRIRSAAQRIVFGIDEPHR